MEKTVSQDSYSYFARTLGVIVKLGLWIGISEAKIREEFEKAISSAREVMPDVEMSEDEEKNQNMMTEIMSFWDRNHRYLDDAGNPLNLTRHGEQGSLNSLFDDTRKSLGIEEVDVDKDKCLEALIDLRAIEATENGLFRRAMDAVPIKGERRVNVGMQLRFMGEHAESIDYNMQQKQLGGLFYNVAHVDGFPEERLPLLNEKMWESGMQFLKDMDAYMSYERDDNVRSRSGKNGVRAGVGMFVIKGSKGN